MSTVVEIEPQALDLDPVFSKLSDAHSKLARMANEWNRCMHVVKFAYQVIEMQERIDYLEAEVERLRDYERKYHEEVNASIKHGEQMMGNWLKFLLSDCVKLGSPEGVPLG